MINRDRSARRRRVKTTTEKHMDSKTGRSLLS